MKSLHLSLAAFAVASVMAGCGGGTSNATGRLSVGITDAPVDDPTASVTLTVSGLEIQGSGERIDVVFNPPKVIPISDLVDGASAELLTDYTLPAGRYEWIRLRVETDGTNDTYLMLGGTSHELTIPSSANTGLKLARGFDVPAGGDADFTIDFDLRKSIVEDAKGYKLKPVLRIVDNVEVGRIGGTVDLATACSGGSDMPAVYVFAGAGAEPSDINMLSGTGPITTSLASDGTYMAAFLAEGSYTVALACKAALDEPESSESIGFASTTYNVTVTANHTTQQNIP